MKAMNVTAFVVGLAGYTAAVIGVALVSVPAALISGGLTAIAWSGFTARSLARREKA